MPLNTVQTHLYSILNGLVLPGQQQTLQAYIAPPTPGDLDQPQVYIWGGQWSDKRQTAPRITSAPSYTQSGYRKLVWAVQLFVMYQTISDAPGVDQAFPLILDAITYALWTAQMPTSMSDPTTNYISQLLSIGESIDGQMAPVVAVTDDGIVLYDALITVQVIEKVQA